MATGARQVKRGDARRVRVDAILTADWHLRDSVPVCRTDDFWAAQWKKVDHVAQLSWRYDACPVLHAGDLLDHWRASPYLLSSAIAHMPPKFWTVLGNHDLPQHNLELAERSGTQTLAAGGALTILPGCHMGKQPQPEHALEIAGRKVLVWHEGVWKDAPPWPNCKARSADSVLEEFPEYDLILTGDFHTPCIERSGDRLLVNPGSLMRQTADQINFRPRVYLWDAERNQVLPEYLPIDAAAVSREHLDIAHDRDKRIEAFVARLDSSKTGAELNFEQNLWQFLREQASTIDARTEEIIRRAVEGA
jgi:predicted phosphodiesterase